MAANKMTTRSCEASQHHGRERRAAFRAAKDGGVGLQRQPALRRTDRMQKYLGRVLFD